MRYKTVRCILEKNGRYLLAQHNNRKPQNLGKWGLPGGHIDKGEDFLSTAKRETLEEFSILIENWQEIGDFVYDEALHKVFAGKYFGSDNLVFDKKEILNIAWFSYEDLLELEQNHSFHTGFELVAIRKYREA